MNCPEGINTEKDDKSDKKVQLPFVGFILVSEDPCQKILVQESKEKDVLSLYSSTNIYPFTENDVFENIGIRKTNQDELRNFVKPDHLKFVQQMFGIKSVTEKQKYENASGPS